MASNRHTKSDEADRTKASSKETRPDPKAEDKVKSKEIVRRGTEASSELSQNLAKGSFKLKPGDNYFRPSTSDLEFISERKMSRLEIEDICSMFAVPTWLIQPCGDLDVYYKLAPDKTVLKTDLAGWVAWHTDDVRLQVANTKTLHGYEVSTVFTGLSPVPGEPPLVFETMVFAVEADPLKINNWKQLGSTWAAAEHIHKLVVEALDLAMQHKEHDTAMHAAWQGMAAAMAEFGDEIVKATEPAERLGAVLSQFKIDEFDDDEEEEEAPIAITGVLIGVDLAAAGSDHTVLAFGHVIEGGYIIDECKQLEAGDEPTNG